MQTFPLVDPKSGTKYAFEIENAFIGPKRIATLLAGMPDVSTVKRRCLFASDPEFHIYFHYLDLECIVWEPYADNSRYWIGPKEVTASQVNITVIEDVFRDYSPPFFRRAIGNLLTLQFLPGRKWN